jgi:PAS domain S-box-containing protein
MNSITTEHIFLIGIIAIQFIFICRLLKKNNRVLPPENSLQSADEKYRDLFENANDAIFILDKDQNYIDVNQRAVELFGYSKEEFSRLNVMDIIPPSQIPESSKEFKKLRNNGKYEKFVGKVKIKNGRLLDIEVNSSIIIINGNVVGSRDIVRDISDRKKVEKEREAIIADLQKALNEIKTLQGIIPICMHCKEIKDDTGSWNQLEKYISEHSEAQFSHGICEKCLEKYYPEIAEQEKVKKKQVASDPDSQN